MIVRGLVETYYDIQKQRIQMSNQLFAYAEGLSEQEQTFIKEITYDKLLDIEKGIDKYLKRHVRDIPIWNGWLIDVKGIGHIFASGLDSWIGDIERFDTISKLWAYAGLAVTEEGRARKRKRGEKANWNARLKTHLWKIGQSFVKTKGGYRDLYDKFRNEYNEKWKDGCWVDGVGSDYCKKEGKCTDLHKYNAATRKVIKVFLAHYWQRSRELKGLPVEPVFIIGRGNHSHEIPIVVDKKSKLKKVV